jgi:hypothetical protein
MNALPGDTYIPYITRHSMRRSTILLAFAAAVSLLTACSDVTGPVRQTSNTPAFARTGKGQVPTTSPVDTVVVADPIVRQEPAILP